MIKRRNKLVSYFVRLKLKILSDLSFVILIFFCLNFPGKLFSEENIKSLENLKNTDSLSVNFSKMQNDSIIQIRTLNRIVPNRAFSVGEKLTFVVRYGFIHAGNAIMEVKELTEIEGRPVYRIISTARSKKAFDLFFKVRDSVETYIDAQGIFSWKFVKRLREGAYKFDLFVNYNQYSGVASVEMIRYHNDEPLRIKNREKFELDIPQYVQDILSSFYFVRTQSLRVGVPLYLTNHDNKKIYNLKVIVQKKEVVKVKAGKFRCIMVQPQLKGESIFRQKGKLWIWLTDDEYKIPVQMKSAVTIGKITTELTKIEGLKLPLPSQIE